MNVTSLTEKLKPMLAWLRDCYDQEPMVDDLGRCIVCIEPTAKHRNPELRASHHKDCWLPTMLALANQVLDAPSADEDGITIDNTGAEQHPSYGMVRFCRTTGGNDVLYGSPIRHHSKIRVEISRGRHKRDLANDWYYSGERLIELELSPHQFAELITSFNFGSGAPCTITWFDGKRPPEPPFKSVRETVREELKSQL